MKKTFTKILFLLGTSTLCLGQWVDQNTNFSVNKTITSIAIVDNNTVFAGGGGTGGNFTKTTNGGSSWSTGIVTGATSNYEFSNLVAFDVNTAWACMYDGANGGGAIFKTTNGGTSWVKQTVTEYSFASSFPNVVHFFDANNGVTMGDPESGKHEIYTTINGGASWSRVTGADLPVAISATEYGEVGQYQAIGNTIWYPTNQGRILISYDKGESWLADTIDITNTFTNRIKFKNELEGLANGNGVAYKTIDGGRTWSTVSIVSGQAYGDDLDYINGFYISSNQAGGASYSNDDGENWIDLDGLSHTRIETKGNYAWSGTINNGGNGGIRKLAPSFFSIGISHVPTCAGEELQVYYNQIGINGFDVYKVEMSWGQFFSQIFTIGELTQVSVDSINSVMPKTSTFSDYFYRVIHTPLSGIPDTSAVYSVLGITQNEFPRQSNSITGPAGKICRGEKTVNLSSGAIFGATSYNWTIPNGVSFNGNTTTQSVNLDFDMSVNSASVMVNGVNSCGSGIIPVDSLIINSYNTAFDGIETDVWGGSLTAPLSGDVVYAMDIADNYEGCNLYAPGTFTGKIAMIKRGACDFGLKVFNAEKAGAVGVVIINNNVVDFVGTLGEGYMSSQSTIPTILINKPMADSLESWITNDPSLNVTLKPYSYDFEFEEFVNANAGTDQTICSGDSTQLTATGGDAYSWSPNYNVTNPNIANPQVYPTTDTSYIVQATNFLSGCSNYDTVNINVTTSVQPTASFTTVIDTAGLTVTLTNTSSNSTDYSWNFGDGSASSTDENPTHAYSTSGTYVITLTANNTCGTTLTGTSTQTIVFEGDDLNVSNGLNYTVSVYPNPSNGSVNFSINGLNNYDLQILDITGKTIINQSNITQTHSIHNLNEGLYLYRIIKNETPIFNGKIVITK